MRWCTPRLFNTVDVYTEFCVASFIYGSPSIQSFRLGKLYHLWFFWLLHLALKCHSIWCGAAGPAPSKVSGVRILVPAPLLSIKVVKSLCKMLQLLTSVSSSEKWQCWIGWVLLKSFSALILMGLHEADPFTFWFLLKPSIFSLDIWAEVKDLGNGTPSLWPVIILMKRLQSERFLKV